MKKTIFILTFFIFQTTFSQFNIDELIGTWESLEKENSEEENIVLMLDNESPTEKKSTPDIILKFNVENKIDCTQSGTPYKTKYELKDSILLIGKRKYIITKLNKNELILKDFDNIFSEITHYKKSDIKIKTIKEYEYIEEKHSNGKLKIKGTLHNGFQDGIWIEWYENGQKKSESNFKNAVPVGTWKEWNLNGKLIKNKKWN